MRNLATVVAIASLSVVVLSGCGWPVSSTPAKAPAADGWTVVYQNDFDGAQLPSEWAVLDGKATVSGGALTLAAEPDSAGCVVLRQPTMPGSVRVDFVGCLEGTKPSDLTVQLNGSSSDITEGYLVQFGGQSNTINRLRRQNEIVVTAEAPLVQAGKKYHVTAENCDGLVRLIVDGKTVLSYQDARPLKGPAQAYVAFYTWGSTMKLDKVTVYSKAAPAPAAP